jgi:hypothetical protein
MGAQALHASAVLLLDRLKLGGLGEKPHVDRPAGDAVAGVIGFEQRTQVGSGGGGGGGANEALPYRATAQRSAMAPSSLSA